MESTTAARAVAPDGESFAIPPREEIEATAAAIVLQARAAGRPIVVVQGLGFVGAAVSAVVSNAVDERGAPRYFVIGTDLADPAGYWKIGKVEAGASPFSSPDPELERMIGKAAREHRNLRATASTSVYALADVVIVNVPLDVEDRTNTDRAAIGVRMGHFEVAMRSIGRVMREDALVIVETTVPIGTTRKVVQRILEEERAARGITTPALVAHSYERVMPGPRYIDSIRKFWRTFAGVDERSSAKARAFLSTIIDTAAFPLYELGDPTASELGKVLENSYRAANIAFIHEWSLAAEQLGVNLFEVVESVRVRKGTHDNLRYPGFGVGGYCLTKDSLLAQWSIGAMFGANVELGVTLRALDINYHMPLHTLGLARQLCGGSLAGKRVVACGVSYLADMPDTRSSPTELFLDALAKEGGVGVAHDPSVKWWPERPDIAVHQDLAACLAGADVLVLAVPHRAYVGMSAADWHALLPAGAVIVDAQNLLSDAKAAELHASGHRLLGVGKGHWKTKGYHQ
jgi:nucleotide sugar dehydrogenase